MNKSAAYTSKEKNLLVQLVRENEVVENKKTDATTLEQKAKAWELISNAYNSQPEVNSPRSSTQLRKLWNNLKQRRRKQNTEELNDMLLTGGGPPKKPMPDSVLEIVEDGASYMDISISCPWDSIAVFEKELADPRNVPKDNLEILAGVEQEGSPSVSVSVNPSTSIDEERSKKANLPVEVYTEKKARIQKLQEAIEQQGELHDFRKKLLEEEKEFCLKKAKLEIRKAEDEAELASLKLAEYKRKMLPTNLNEDHSDLEHSQSPFQRGSVDDVNETVSCTLPLSEETETPDITIKQKMDSTIPQSSTSNIEKLLHDPQIDMILGAIEKLQEISNRAALVRTEDSYDCFGKYVASMLRSVGPPIAIKLQRSITSVIINGMCQEPNSSSQMTNGRESNMRDCPDD